MYLFIPYVNSSIQGNKSSGLGHLIRCLRSVLNIGGDILLSKEHQIQYEDIIKKFKSSHKKHKEMINIVEFPKSRYDAVILDMKEISANEVFQYMSYGPIIGIDLGGSGRSYATYLIDTMPNKILHAPNLYAHGASLSPQIISHNSWSRSCKNILYYASSDSTIQKEEYGFLSTILSNNAEITITLLCRDLAFYKSLSEMHAHLTVIFIDFDIMNRIYNYDLFITHFGIGAYEAVSAKVPVLLINPSEYHRELSEYANFKYKYLISRENNVSIIKKTYAQIKEYIHELIYNELTYADLVISMQNIKDYEEITSEDKAPRFISSYIKDIAETYTRASHYLPVNPWCGLQLEAAVYRDSEKTIFECQHTKQWHQVSFSKKFPRYKSSYFFDEFKNQYGASYIESFSSIVALMRTRMKYIKTLLPTQFRTKKITYKNLLTSRNVQKYIKSDDNPVFVDIGCAYGAMLQVALEHEYIALGIEINKEAVRYCSEIIHSNAVQGDISKGSLCNILKKSKVSLDKIAVCSAFYVIEHLPSLEKFLSEIFEVLPCGGLFVCSVPNGSGISMRKNKKEFFRQSPIDHFSVFTPRGLSNILENAGFGIAKIRVTGHHPERFGLPKFMFFLVNILSRICKLGDTFEMYAYKKWKN